MPNGSLLNHILHPKGIPKFTPLPGGRTSSDKLHRDGCLEKLITDNYEDIYRYCCCHLNHRQTAEDITQEVFLKFLSNLDSYKDYGKIKNYLYVIAGNLMKNYFKKQKETCVEDLEKREEAAPDGTDNILDRLVIMEALSALENVEKDIVILRYYQDLRIKDISRIVGIPASTVRYKLRHAEKILKERLNL